MRDERTPKDVCGEAREDGCLNTQFLVSRAFVKTGIVPSPSSSRFFLREGERLYTG